MNRIQFGRLSVREILGDKSHQKRLRDYAQKCWPPVANALIKSLQKKEEPLFI